MTRQFHRACRAGRWAAEARRWPTFGHWVGPSPTRCQSGPVAEPSILGPTDLLGPRRLTWRTWRDRARSTRSSGRAGALVGRASCTVFALWADLMTGTASSAARLGQNGPVAARPVGQHVQLRTLVSLRPLESPPRRRNATEDRRTHHGPAVRAAALFFYRQTRPRGWRAEWALVRAATRKHAFGRMGWRRASQEFQRETAGAGGASFRDHPRSACRTARPQETADFKPDSSHA